MIFNAMYAHLVAVPRHPRFPYFERHAQRGGLDALEERARGEVLARVEGRGRGGVERSRRWHAFAPCRGGWLVAGGMIVPMGPATFSRGDEEDGVRELNGKR